MVLKEKVLEKEGKPLLAYLLHRGLQSLHPKAPAGSVVMLGLSWQTEAQAWEPSPGEWRQGRRAFTELLVRKLAARVTVRRESDRLRQEKRKKKEGRKKRREGRQMGRRRGERRDGDKKERQADGQGRGGRLVTSLSLPPKGASSYSHDGGGSGNCRGRAGVIAPWRLYLLSPRKREIKG